MKFIISILNVSTHYELILPPATTLRQGNVFIPVCNSVHKSILCQGGGLCQGDPPHTVTCGQYASYRNAFLLYYCIANIILF